MILHIIHKLKQKQPRKKGLFDKEIVPVKIQTRKAEIVFDKDEYINYTTTREKNCSITSSI